MKNLEVLERSSAKFEVRVDGHPTPEIAWFKDGVDIEIKGIQHEASIESPKYEAETGEDGRAWLVINRCGEDDDAEYSCRASNATGQVTTKAELYVEPFGEQLPN
jgi:hypothetical protein